MTDDDGIDWSRWPLTRKVVEAGEPEADDEDDLAGGYSLLAAIAEDSGGRMRQIRPGAWAISKISDEPPIGEQTGTE